MVAICLLGTVLEMSCKPVKAEIVENGGHIPMDEDINEKTPLLSGAIIKLGKDEGKVTI